MAYANAAELRDRINKKGSIKDGILTALIAAAERNINTTTNRPDGFVAAETGTARVQAGNGGRHLRIPECVEIVSVAAKAATTDSTYTAWTASDWIGFAGDPEEPEFQPLEIGKPYDGIMIAPSGDYSYFPDGYFSGKRRKTRVPMIEITSKWGYSIETPPDIKEACLMQAARWFKRFEGSMSDALASDELGALLYRQSLDPDIKRILVDGRYIRPALGRR